MTRVAPPIMQGASVFLGAGGGKVSTIDGVVLKKLGVNDLFGIAKFRAWEESYLRAAPDG